MFSVAKSFGSANSSAFVNGVLDRLIPKEKRTPVEEQRLES